MTLSNDIQAAIESVGFKTDITVRGKVAGEKANRKVESSSKANVWVRVTKTDNVLQTNGIVERVVYLWISGANTYKPSPGDAIDIDGKPHYIRNIDEKRLGQEVYRFDVEASP